jgi:hypothetical protein
MHDRQLAGKRLFVSLSSANSKDPDAKYMERLMREKRELTANAIDISDKNSAVKVASGGYALYT